MTLWPLINLLIGLVCVGAGMYQFFAGREEKFLVPFFKLWHVNVFLGILNLGIGLFFILWLMN